jgi:hypothetical protein
VTQEELRYCRQDVKITQQLLNAAKQELTFTHYRRPPDKAYSPHVSQGHMREMNIIQPSKSSVSRNPDFDASVLWRQGGGAHQAHACAGHAT